SSVVGFYRPPLFTRLLPERQDTPLTKVGALAWGWGPGVSPGPGCPQAWDAMTPPAPSHAGITRFDLLGDFGRFNWLGNFHIIFLYNMGFAGLTTLCLVKRVSWAVQAELICAFGE
ncbi:LMBRL protein, partial [Chloroceryle aenea]|nr:LMBRL protein [Chloroceryle aenea]